MDEEERAEADRLLADERRERDGEPEPEEISYAERWVMANPRAAAEEIEALQEFARRFMVDWHQELRDKHMFDFEKCGYPECRRIRDRLRPLQSGL
jgi:hypothetical protein